MADLFLPPSKEQVQKAQELYGDALLCWATNAAVTALNQMHQEKLMQTGESLYLTNAEICRWKFYTRRLLWDFGSARVLNMMLELNTQNADEYWANFVPPEIKEDEPASIDLTAQELSGKIKISDVARKYGLKKGKKLWLCPFHDDKNPSLSLSDSKGCFLCFGCKSKGDIITFVRKLEDLRK